MPSLIERIDDLLTDDITVEGLDHAINLTTARLALLQALRKQIDAVAAVLNDKPAKREQTKKPASKEPSARALSGRFALFVEMHVSVARESEHAAVLLEPRNRLDRGVQLVTRAVHGVLNRVTTSRSVLFQEHAHVEGELVNVADRLRFLRPRTSGRLVAAAACTWPVAGLGERHA